MMNLILFERDLSQKTTDVNERKKRWSRAIDMVKKEIEKGEMLAFGMRSHLDGGFMLTKKDAKEIAAERLTRPNPPDEEIMQFLSIEDLEDLLKKI